MNRMKNEINYTVREEDEKLIIEGYFAKFDVETQLSKNTYEVIKKGAFKRSIEKNDIRCLFNHDSNNVLGRTTNQTLKLLEDDIGLFGQVIINKDDEFAKNVYARVKRGDVSGASFGFYVVDSNFFKHETVYVEELLDVELLEVSICTFPQYTETELKARSKEYKKIELKRRLKKYV